MRTTPILKSTLAAAAALMMSAGLAAACETDTPKGDLTDAQALALFTCIGDKLLEGYQKSGRAEADAYRGWRLSSTNPFISATHGGRFVNHYTNDVAWDAYSRYAEDGVAMPVGSILAKESFTIRKKNGKVRRGPLFLMEKVAAGSLPEFDDWRYTTILPNGKVGGPKPSFCHECHKGVIDGQDAMFYPDEAYRVAAE